MSEVRTVSSTGGEKGVKDERHDLIPKAALDALSRVYAYGATKYADHNWRRGYEWSKSYAACQRHLTAFWDGETNDPESGLPHLAHAAFHVFALLTWLEEQGEGGQFDDRYVPKHRAGDDGWELTDWNPDTGFPSSRWASILTRQDPNMILINGVQRSFDRQADDAADFVTGKVDRDCE